MTIENSPNVRSILVVLFLAAGATFTACAHSQPMQTSSLVPAAEGRLKTDTGENGNTTLTLNVKHLADPAKVAPGATTYVVWIEQPQGTVQNVGALKVGPDRNGELNTVTPSRAFQVFITAEPNVAADRPSNERLLFANVRQ